MERRARFRQLCRNPVARAYGSAGCEGKRLTPRCLEEIGEGRRQSRLEEELNLDMVRARGLGGTGENNIVR